MIDAKFMVLDRVDVSTYMEHGLLIRHYGQKVHNSFKSWRIHDEEIR